MEKLGRFLHLVTCILIKYSQDSRTILYKSGEINLTLFYNDIWFILCYHFKNSQTVMLKGGKNEVQRYYDKIYKKL